MTLTRLCFALWCLGLGCRPALAQNQAKVDSLTALLPTTQDTAKVLVLLELTKQYFDTQPDRAEEYATRALRLAQEHRWPYGTALAREKLGTAYRIMGQYPQAQALLLQAVEHWKKSGNTEHEFVSSYTMANVLTDIGEPRKARKWLEVALRLAQSGLPTKYLTASYNALGNNEYQLGRLPSAIAWYRQSLALAEQTKNARSAAFALNNIAHLHNVQGQPQQALNYLLRALPLMQQAGGKDGQAMLLSTIAQTYQYLHQPAPALRYALQARELAAATKSKLYGQQIDSLLARIYAGRGQYDKAYQYALEGFALERDMLNETKVRALAEQQTRYETQEKERNIQLLTQRNQLQRVATERQTALRNLAAGTSVLLLLLMGVGYRRYHGRQRLLRQLDAQNQEKALLLKEVHHRVKNNLQIILSLLNTQLKTLRDPTAAHVIRESQSRVQAMALLHQSLYQTDSLARVDMQRYLTELVQALRRTFRAEAQGLDLLLDVEPVQLNTHTAVPLGLIVNELLTNALKYAFVGPAHNGPPQVRVSLHTTATGHLELLVSDNGVGLPPDVDPHTVHSLGLNLVDGLVQQLDATFTLERTGGTCFRIVFTELTPPEVLVGFAARP
ncbi:tetratricopeptide repeat-containing sensor histidine kinase [Hymenobacter weizhouensis]|uniref:tetratricopeptide repeat-containing sensor histidine kinase n=1 Tax=Hymenobacter sp. YIM 151500-1 TaxID=2987689 RepID=UPI0022277C68|nr:tetratricopeptide repeat protein [Hymenobacter sp. YIM 151500-1]UYZ62499.1 tetratricopeptide repeat protein [Hymenobacter sp. YIM 151500-1]